MGKFKPFLSIKEGCFFLQKRTILWILNLISLKILRQIQSFKNKIKVEKVYASNHKRPGGVLMDSYWAGPCTPLVLSKLELTFKSSKKMRMHSFNRFLPLHFCLILFYNENGGFNTLIEGWMFKVQQV